MHPLPVANALNAHHPMAERHNDSRFIVVDVIVVETLRQVDKTPTIHVGEIMLSVGPDHVITRSSPSGTARATRYLGSADASAAHRRPVTADGAGGGQETSMPPNSPVRLGEAAIERFDQEFPIALFETSVSA